MTFGEFFRQATGGLSPYQWQAQAAEIGLPDVIDVPTGWGKTEGAAAAWVWRSFVVEARDEPRHLVYCLPMRVLVQQTVERLSAMFDRLRNPPTCLNVPVFSLMGGQLDDEWARWPDRPWVLVGTQDQLLSRALNRGYAMNRFDWPIHFGLLNNDCRWMVDEVQLMGPGLRTTAQLDWMRHKRFAGHGSCPTTWMSATLGPEVLSTVDRDADGLAGGLRVLSMDAGDDDPERRDARRPVDVCASLTPERLARKVREAHVAGTLSLVVCNTVASARAVFDALRSDDLAVLITSRFRGVDRAEAQQRLLRFERLRRQGSGAMVANHGGLICVSTQVIEAGVDISAHRLWSEVAPWPSVVQRLGRLNRDGRDQQAQATFWYPTASGPVVDRVGPYEKGDLDTAQQLLAALAVLSSDRTALLALSALAQMSEHASQVAGALAPKAAAMPRAFDVHGLFATEPDLHGGFTDVSEFVRDADPEPELTVVWRDWVDDSELRGDLEGPPIEPLEEGCPVRVSELRALLKGKSSQAWSWDDDRGSWQPTPGADLCPGMVVMLNSEAGGYDSARGWTGSSADRLADVPVPGPGRAYVDETRSEQGYWCSLDRHLEDTAREAKMLVSAVDLDEKLSEAVVAAAGLHDLGKAHPQWQGAIPALGRLTEGEREQLRTALHGDVLAKAPRVLSVIASPSAIGMVDDTLQGFEMAAHRLTWADSNVASWLIDRRLIRSELEVIRGAVGVSKAWHVPLRPNLRHEAATALAMWDRHRSGDATWSALAVYLAAAHHGKLRTVMRSRSMSGEDVCGVPRSPRELLVDDVAWPLDFTVATDGAAGEWSPDGFRLTGHGWTALVADLLGPWRRDGREPWDTGAVAEGEPKGLGPFLLAYLEALVRVADWRASDQPSGSVAVMETPT